MDNKSKEFAESALNYILIGSQLDGVRFGVGPGSFLIQFEHYSNKTPDEIWLNIESKWGVLSKGSANYPKSEHEMNELSEEEEYMFIFELRRDKVKSVRLGNPSPHLYIEFESGKILFVNGHHDSYECWQVGDGPIDQEWLIVAVPGDGIATWVPDSFI